MDSLIIMECSVLALQQFLLTMWAGMLLSLYNGSCIIDMCTGPCYILTGKKQLILYYNQDKEVLLVN